MSNTIQIVDPGLFTTVQDRGRYGFQDIGVPISGAMDQFALRSANSLVGNDQTDAVLEMTVIGPTTVFNFDALIAITGADLSAQLDGSPIPRWEPIFVAKGSQIKFEGMKDGLRAYKAIAGGIDVPEIMGSQSTYVKAGFGGFEGRAITNNDLLSIRLLESDPIPSQMPSDFTPPVYGQEHPVRVMLGPQDIAFQESAITKLLDSVFTVSLDSDRMGYRLEGPKIGHKEGPDIISEGNALGAVQVSGDGVPTVLMSDCGTTGGYTKIATVITSDIGQLAQAVPGDTVTFSAVDMDEAISALHEHEKTLAAISRIEQEDGSTSISVLVDGEPFEVLDSEGQAISMDRDIESRTLLATARTKDLTFSFEVEVRGDDDAG